MVNKVILIGNVGKDPEIRNLENGNKVASFSLATSETYKNKQGERVTNTEWHNITCFGNVAGIVENYVNKGDMLYLEGSVKTRSWDSNDGKKYITEINVNSIKMLGNKSGGQQQNISNSDNDLLF